jgi:hypothetical protein
MKKCRVLKNYPIPRISGDLLSVEAMAKKLDAECGIIENAIYDATFDS